MYSYEDRIRAVKLHIKLGKRMGVALRQLGYPTKNSLKDWYREFQQNDNLPTGYVRQRYQYTQEHKRHAVDHFVEQGQCLIHTIRSLGYPSRETLRAWIAELRPDYCRLVASKNESAPFSVDQKQFATIELCSRQESARVVAQSDTNPSSRGRTRSLPTG